MELKWGNQSQLSFANEEEYYMALGIFANPKLSRVYIEDNAKRGSFSDASRLHIYSHTKKGNLPQALKNAVKSKFVCKFIFQLCGFIYATFIFKRFD